ncbi:MAG: CZB domain-containing protein, partial [Deltaproteobacteria bacterium]|nr:CZB domain-containing protein [Deltaproteobacteria bacterium]
MVKTNPYSFHVRAYCLNLLILEEEGEENMRLKLSRQIFSGLLVCGALLVLLGSVSYFGIGNMRTMTDEAMSAVDTIVDLRLMEIDHLKFAARIEKTLLQVYTPGLIIDVQTDDHLCNFGKWLYGEPRRQVERVYPAAAPILKKFEEPHRLLHSSIKEINLNLSEAEDLEGAKGDYRSITLPALEKVMEIFTELSDFLTVEEEKLHDAAARAGQVQMIVLLVALGGFL